MCSVLEGEPVPPTTTLAMGSLYVCSCSIVVAPNVILYRVGGNMYSRVTWRYISSASGL